jgi:4-diphosphocytidyl-2-C-methyl-D-erythritol kinase
MAMADTSASFSAAYPAPAKLNLMLKVVGRRADGYHLLQTVFRFIDFGDSLRFRVRTDGVIARVNDIPGVPPESDLCVRAARLLQQVSGTALGADIHLDKRLPMGGGLGGGSSDAATTLLALNDLWKLALARSQLIDISVELGADVPVFVFGENAFAEGIGEQLQALDLPPAWYVVLCPPVAVPTAAVFSHQDLKRDSKKVTIQGFSGAGGQALSGIAGNDLQALVVRLYPQVERHLAWLAQHARHAGAPGDAMMTGSGACVFAPFDSEAAARAVLAQLPGDMRGFVAQGLQRHPLLDLGN